GRPPPPPRRWRSGRACSAGRRRSAGGGFARDHRPRGRTPGWRGPRGPRRAGGGMPPCPPARSTPRGGRRSLRGSQPQILPPQPAPLHQAPEAGAGLRFDPPAQGCGVEIVKMAAVALEEEQSVAAPEGGGDQHVELYQVPKPQPPRELGELPGALV